MTLSVDIHILQTVPPSNLNRDDTGSPKTAFYGGVNRARVSSQAWKRATRRAFGDAFSTTDLGVRTKRVVELLAEEISRLAPEHGEKALELAERVLAAAGIKLAKPKAKKDEVAGPPESGYLLFLSRRQVTQLAELAIESADEKTVDKKSAKAAMDSAHSVDVSLFGRMVADDAELNVDAAAQVAHALSVHRVDNEFDYFTAVDDRKDEADETGAGMIGTVEFNSSTLYRYATVNVLGLQANLGDGPATVRAIQEFVRAFVTSMPTGKQNTFANRTLPDAVVVQVRPGQPVNLVGAFENPVVATDGVSRVRLAAEALAERASCVDAAYGTEAEATYVVAASPDVKRLTEMGEPTSLQGALDGLGTQLLQRLSSS